MNLQISSRLAGALAIPGNTLGALSHEEPRTILNAPAMAPGIQVGNTALLPGCFSDMRTWDAH